MTGVSGKRIIWKEFKSIIKGFGLPVKINDIELSLTFPNGSTVYVAGANDASEIEKFRGLAIKLCYIDECQSFRAHIEDLIDDIIAPALMDYAGSLCLIGTPGPVPTGYFYECAVKSEVWSKHHWTFWDNPFIPKKSGKTHQEVLDRELKRRGVTVNDPGIQREWFGKWVLDSDALVLHFSDEKNHYTSLPDMRDWTYILGIDVGYDDADALAVLGWSESDPHTYLIEEKVVAKQGITELVEQVKDLQKRYTFSKMVMDMGGLGKKIGEEMSRRYLIPVEPADKARKIENLELLDDALRTGMFKAKSASRFAQDSYLIEKDKNKSRPDRIVISDRYHSDIADAVLYAFKLSPAYAYEPPEEKPRYGTKEWADQQQTEMFESALEHFTAEELERKRFDGEDW